MRNIDKFYDKKVVKKPWGYEYVVYRKGKDLSVTLLKINYKKKTSLHCHPNKKSGFILISGKAEFQLGLWKKRSEVHSSPSKRMIARGLFHQIKSISKDGLLALEFETPSDKKDLVRFKDSYGRQDKPYEGKKHTKNIGSNFIKFKKPKIGLKQNFIIGKTKLFIETHKNFKSILKNKQNTIFAILNGSIVDKNKRKVISHGDIIKTNDLKTLAKVFKIHKNLSVLKVIK
tara:strand:+ start:5222 stop:5911 length:690 start_codon:yes stop_codon:yes gene_type:complete